MREYRFRGFTLGREHNVWTFGSLVQKEHATFIKTKEDEVPDIVAPESVGMKTERYDMLGAPIYEGDVLSNGYHNYVVEWSAEWCAFVLAKDNVSRLISEQDLSCFRVIGNTYNMNGGVQ